MNLVTQFDYYTLRAVGTHTGYPEGQHPLVFNALCLAGEVGEMSEKIKKRLRDANGCFNPADIHALMLECGDILWYLNRQAEELRKMMARFDVVETPEVVWDAVYPQTRMSQWTGLRLIANLNLNKLESRQQRGVIKGEGDDR